METKGKSKSNDAHGLRDLLEHGLKDIYWAEKELTKTLPKMAEKASSPDLVKAIKNHLKETEGHVTRLEQVFEAIDLKPVAKKCDAMEGLIKEGQHVIEETEEGVVRDAGIIAASQKVEHYEIATYGTLHAFALTLGEDRAASLLEMTLNEEKQADVSLTEIAMSHINVEAMEVH